MKKTVIFTDLDGTLLDESSYSFQNALPALRQISSGGIPLILCSSKTCAELQMYRKRMENTHPFISENGGGIFIPHGYFKAPVEAEGSKGYQLIRLGTPYAEIRKQFVRLREQLRTKVRGFADMSSSEIAELTGLAEEDAVLARCRDFDEAFVFDGPPDESFLSAIEASGLRWTQGRIFHIMGNHDKGRAVNILISLYKQEYGGISSVALGDSLNDQPMLMAVELPVLVRHEDGSFDKRIAIPDILKTQLSGPAGWNEAVLRLLTHGTDKESGIE